VWQRRACSVLIAIAALGLGGAGALPADDLKFPDWKGEWMRAGGGSFDPTRPTGLGQQAPLTPEYQAILEASVADQAAGGQGNNTMGDCYPPGMPRTMINYEGMEFIVTPDTTYIMLLEPSNQLRRIYTDGRAFPSDIRPSFLGYSIGQWLDQDRDGRYDTLMVETRAIRGPHSYDSSGMPFHRDGKLVVKEKIYADKADRDLIHNEITSIDNALTRPWTVTRNYRRTDKVMWPEVICGEDNHQVKIGQERYYISGDGHLMPTRTNQPPPGLKGFAGAPR
jgi:hypothetical protein